MSLLNKSYSQRIQGFAGPEVRRTVSFQAKSGSISGCSSSMSLCDMMEPPDWEELATKLINERDPFAYPPSDVEVLTIPRRIRTIQHVLPEEDLSEASLHVRDCVRCYTSDWVAVDYHYRPFSGSFFTREKQNERIAHLQALPRQQYEIDFDPLLVSTPTEEMTIIQSESQPSSGRQSVSSISSSSSCNDTLTPRGSWASLDLRSSSSDPLLPDILERKPPDQLDQLNEARRMECRHKDLLGLFLSYLDDEDAVERRMPAEMPSELIGHRVLVHCHQLKLELDVEPIFASIALYDVRERKKVSENFYFNMNSDSIRQMLSAHIPQCDISTMSRSAVFDILHPSPDLFFVIKLEKVLQGDLSECIEPYIKEDKNREKVRAAALLACERLGKYRMPFAWTAISIMSVLNGSTSSEKDHGGTADRDSLNSSSQSNSLDRKASTSSLEQLKRRAGEVGGSLTRRGSLERRAHAPTACGPQHTGQISSNPYDEVAAALDLFKPIGITVTSFFKQEPDKMKDDDLYKFLQEIKRPSSILKKLKCVPGMLKVEIMPCPDEVKNGLTPELAKLHPYSDEKARPCKEILPIPIQPILLPHYQYRNLLFVFPKDLNFTAYTSRTGSARNIAVRIQLMAGEQQSEALFAIFGRSSCAQFTNEAYTTVTYHNKCPSFYDEIKVMLPSNLGDQHHLFFTFYHISCQKKPVSAPEQEKTIETPLGYTWLPLCRSGRLSSGEYNLPVMIEEPPQNYSYIFPDVLLPGTKWIDNHKPIFTISLEPFSSVHPMDSQIERFVMACEAIQEGNIPARIGLANMEAEFRASILELPNANAEALVKNLTVVLDRLVSLLLIPPILNNQQLNVAQDVFMCINHIFTNVTNINEGSTCDNHGRSPLLSSYVQYQCLIPKPHNSGNADVQDGVSNSSFTACKVLHEEMCLQWVVASGATRDLAMLNSWTLFELMVKSMVEQLSWNNTLDAPRKTRFSDQYIDDITMLVSNVTSEIISRYEKDGRLTQSLNNSLAFFLFDLLSIMDRGLVFSLVRTYYKQMSAKISSLPDAVPLILNKIAFLRIICSHEHFAALNLPGGTPYTAHQLVGSSSGAPASPSPSTHSAHSTHSVQSHRSDTSYQMSGADRGSFSELSADFKHQHFLVGLLLSELASVLDIQSPMLQGKAAGAVLSVLASHDGDPRWTRPELRARLAALYIPLLGIIMDAYPQLYRGFHTNKDRVHLSEDFNIIGSQQSGIASPDYEYKQVPRVALNSETTRNLLMCVVWVLRWADRGSLQRWCGELPPQRLHALLMLLGLCYACFEYKGKKEIQRCTQQNVRKTTDIKTKLEDVILGQGSARSELIMRRKGMGGDRRQERWRKDWQRGSNTPAATIAAVNGSQTPTATSTSININTGPTGQHPAATSQIEGGLSAEVSLTLLHTLEMIVQVVSSWDSHHGVFNMVLKVLLLGMEKNQSTTVLQHMFATLRSLVLKFQCLVAEAEEAEELRLGTCGALLRHCGALAGAARAHASAALYELMRQNYDVGNNFARVKMQVTMSLSSLVGTSATFNEDSLRRALKTILTYAEQDADLQETTFPEQVKDLVFNLHMILSDTVKMKEFQEDPEMLLDLMHRIAKGYQNSPDLRLTWLNNMAQKHMERSNHTEAGMCLVHGAALALEGAALGGGENSAGAQGLLHVSWNVLEEALATDTPALATHPTAQHFTNHTLQALLEHAAGELHTAGMYEAVSSVYKVLIPIAEYNKDYKKLANIYGKLNEAFTRIDQLQGKRVFGTYFRVGFYGSKFGDLNGEEFIYKEPTLTKLPEIFSRLENFYGQRFGVDNVVIIKDSNTVDTSTLDPDKAYIQITYVEPYFEPYELRHRTTIFERNFNIKRFIYATPFTTSGRAHGELYEQCKRKTILTTAQFFPYVKTRIQVVSREQVILSPIEVAIEDIQKKINELAAATSQEPPDPKILQMVVQGCIGTTVNQGPLEMAQVFLAAVAEGKQPPTKLTNKLRLCFKDFSKKCHDALKKNKNLIGIDQREYQKELEKNYQRFTERLAPLIQMAPGYVTQLNNVTPKTMEISNLTTM